VGKDEVPIWMPWFRGEPLLSPRTPTPDITRKVIDSYPKAILLHQRLVKGEKRGGKGKAFSKAIVRLEIEMFLDGYYKA